LFGHELGGGLMSEHGGRSGSLGKASGKWRVAAGKVGGGIHIRLGQAK
jgi:hypothetical protein